MDCMERTRGIEARRAFRSVRRARCARTRTAPALRPVRCATSSAVQPSTQWSRKISRSVSRSRARSARPPSPISSAPGAAFALGSASEGTDAGDERTIMRHEPRGGGFIAMLTPRGDGVCGLCVVAGKYPAVVVVHFDVLVHCAVTTTRKNCAFRPLTKDG